MTAQEVKKMILEKGREWFGAGIKKASELPFPKFWKKTAGWLCFHAPHTGDRLMETLIDDAICDCCTAICEGKEPEGWTVPAETVKIWADDYTRHMIDAADRRGRKWHLDSSGKVQFEAEAFYRERVEGGEVVLAVPFSTCGKRW